MSESALKKVFTTMSSWIDLEECDGGKLHLLHHSKLLVLQGGEKGREEKTRRILRDRGRRDERERLKRRRRRIKGRSKTAKFREEH